MEGAPNCCWIIGADSEVGASNGHLLPGYVWYSACTLVVLPALHANVRPVPSARLQSCRSQPIDAGMDNVGLEHIQWY